MTTQGAAQADHKRIEALLTSDDWQNRLAQARAQRAKALQQRGISDDQPAMVAPAVIVTQAPARRWVGLALGLLIGGIAAGLCTWAMLHRPAPLAPTASAPIAPQNVAAPGLGYGAFGSAWDIPATFSADTGRVAVPVAAFAVPALSFGAAPISPDSFSVATPPDQAELLRRLEALAPAGTRVHLPSGITAPGASDLTLLSSKFGTDSNIVRYFHAGDRNLANRIASRSTTVPGPVPSIR